MVINHNFCLTPFNTFGVEIRAENLSIITSVRDLHKLFKHKLFSEKRLLVLSKGSNILFTDDFDGLVLLNQILGKKIIKETKDYIILKVSSGEFWPSLVDYTVDNNWGGLENMTDIPGKVGAAPIQNIGAYGTEIKDTLISLEAFDLESGETIELSNKDCNFGYRTSIFKTTHKNKYFITSISLKLSKKPIINLSYKPLAEAFKGMGINTITVKDISKKIFEIRNSKIPDPSKLKNAGSFFKNPIINSDKLNELKFDYQSIPKYVINDNEYKIPAAWLIEQSGWKGKRIGNVGTYEKQALILINYSKATGKEILDFASLIQKSVDAKFGIKLDMEVNVV